MVRNPVEQLPVYSLDNFSSPERISQQESGRDSISFLKMESFWIQLVVITLFCSFELNSNEMIVKQIYKTGNKSQLLINIPENFRSKRHILVLLDDSVDTQSDKMDLMKLASKDPLFLADIETINNDFRNVDSEIQ